MPPTTLPMIWLCAVLVFRTRPPAIRADNAGDADDSELFIYLHFGKHRRMGIARVRAVIREVVGLFLFDPVDRTVPHRIGNRDRAARFPLAYDLAIRKRDVFQLYVCQR